MPPKPLSLTLSQVDSIFLHTKVDIEFLLFYSKALSPEAISTALEAMSRVFWPVFGEYREGKIRFRAYDESFLSVETLERDFLITDTEEALFQKNRQLGAKLEGRLFTLKVVQFKNGTALIPKVNHLVGDGYSFFYFLSVLAKLSQTSNLPFRRKLILRLYKPNLKRRLLPHPAIEPNQPNELEDPDAFSVQFESIQVAEVDRLARSIQGRLDRHVTSNDLLSAWVAKRLVKARTSGLGEHFSLMVPIDVRRKTNRLGSKFFGNGIQLHKVNFTNRELIDYGVEDIALRIRDSMPNIDTSSYLAYLQRLRTALEDESSEAWLPFDPQSGFLVTNLSRLPVNSLDFGTGLPDVVLPLTLARNTAVVSLKKDHYHLRVVS